ncbi:chaplin [Actinacidiphila glaucinigra]|uniref:Small secreted domain n=1 Tax=Actinacidiphila glaucinigra TaxID=235986 RepID=A0A239JUP7_9ACTN|nr:chaplin [Actinacidiphila glaucinigra]SNT09515.1 Small secreted domain [Actinacidiphila glaucinigra]
MRQVAKKGLLTAVATGGVLAVTGGMAYADSHASGVAAGSPGVLSGNTIQAPVNIPINACGNTVNVVGLLNPAAGNTCVNGSIDHGKGHGYGQGKGYGKKESGGYGGKSGGSYRDKDGGKGGYGGGKGYGQGGSKGYGGGKGGGKGYGDDGYGHSGGGASARAAAVGSPGVLSGNVIQAPINIPVNVCGNTIDVIGILNPAAGNTCANTGGGYHHGGKGHHHKPGKHGNHHKPGKENGGGGGGGGNGGGGNGGGNQPQSMGHGGPSLARTGAGDIATGLLTSAGLLLGGAVLFRRARAVKN